MKQNLVEVLKATLIGDTNKLSEANSTLADLSQQPGYCMTLMEIVDQQTSDLSIQQAALIQLKNTIKARWKTKVQNHQLPVQEKISIRNSLITAVIRCSKKHMLIKLYRQIICNVVSHEFESWMPIEDILGKLRANEDVIAIFHCILGICTNFEFSIIDKQRSYYSQFLFTILPEILNVVKNNINNAEVIYLSLKILYKAVHYEVPKEIKVLTNPWMELILLTITSHNQNMKVQEFQAKGTHEFLYFHSKKWATRILMRYVQKHAKEVQFSAVTDNKEYSQNWYKTYGETFMQAILQQFSIPTIRKVRYFQLKIIQAWVTDKPHLMLNYASSFQYDLLLPFMALAPEDEKLAQDDVIQYLRNEEEPGINYTNLKKAATDVWTAYFSMGSRNDRQNNTYEPGPMFEENFKFLLAKLESENLVEKELAMYLFCQLRLSLNKVPQVKVLIPQILVNLVIPQFQNPAMLLRARANDMFFEYGKSIQDITIVNKAAEGIFFCMSQDPSPLVRIKAAIAFHPILYHKDTKQLVKPMLKNILQIYLKLIELYDLEQVVAALEYIVADFSSQIGPLATDLFKYLSGLFVKMFNKDVEQSQNEDYGGQIEMAASGTLKAMTQIIEAPLELSVRKQLEQLVLQICAFIFSNESVDYTEDVMYLLNAHLYKLDKLSPEVWFFYQVVIYFLIGIPKDLWAQIENLPMSPTHKNILMNIRDCRNTEFLEHSVPVLRNFMSKGANMILNQKDEFKHNFLQMFFYLIGNIYKAHHTDIESETEIDCATLLMVYLIESFPSEFTKPILPAVWNFVKFNYHRGKTSYLKQVNLQLIFVLFWKHPADFQQLCAVTQKYFPALFNFTRERISKLHEPHERKRIILGMCSLMMVPNKTQELTNQLHYMFQTVMKMVQKNAKNRVIISLEVQERKNEIMKLDEQNSDEDNYESQDQDDDLWDEDYHERFESILARTDEIQYFKDTMNWIQANDQNLYQGLLSQVPAEKINELTQKMDEALSIKAEHK